MRHDTSRKDRSRPVFARYYAAMAPRMDSVGLGRLRDELLSGLAGEVLEVGCGNGMNFARYPGTVTSVRAVEPEPHLRRLARAAARSEVPIEVVAGTGEAVPLPDNSVDAAVLCLVLCSVPDPVATVGELARVIRPGGALVFLEHCAADTSKLRRVQKFADATIWPMLAGGCHLSRDPLATIEGGGFSIDSVRRFRFPQGSNASPASPHVLGRARLRLNG